MKKTILSILVVVALAAAGFYLFQSQNPMQVSGQEIEPTAAPDSAIFSLDLSDVEAVGRLVPTKHDQLQFTLNGIVAEVLVSEGQEVQEGDILARLRDEQQMKLAVSQARLEVMNAENTLAALEENAPLQAAQALYDSTQVERAIEKIMKRRTSMDYPRATKEDIDDAYQEYLDAEDAFNTAADYFSASDDVYKAAKLKRNDALSRYNWLIGEYTDLEKKEVEAELLLNQRKLADLQRLYDIYSQGPDPDDVALAKARLDVAKDQLAAAEAGYEDLVLRAPFSGKVVQLDMEKGQLVAANQPVLLLADLSRWNIETEDLTELSVTKIQEGDRAEVTIDALPNLTFHGVVTEIKEIGETRRGDITYTVVIQLEEVDPAMRWNMTSPITISSGT